MLRRSTAVASAAVVGAAVAAFAVQTPALAAATSCDLLYDDRVCTTGELSANPRYHALYASASAYSADHITCWVYDVDNWATVATLVSTTRTTTRVIRGLYGRYVMGCAQTGGPQTGSGHGEMRNGDIWV